MVDSKSKLKKLFEEKEEKQKKTQPPKPNFSLYKDNPNYYVSEKQFSGLKNYGNTCFCNVVMQSIVTNKQFFKKLSLYYDKLINKEQKVIDSTFSALYNFYQSVYFYLNKNSSLSSSHLQTLSVLFDPYQKQNDTHEFLLFLLNKLHEECLLLQEEFKDLLKLEEETDEENWEEVKKDGKRMKLMNKSNEFPISIIKTFFGGTLKHETTRQGVSLSESRIDPFYAITIDSKESSLEGNIDIYFSKKTVDKGLYQKSYIENLPEIFIIQLKSYYYDKNTKTVNKDYKKVTYNDSLSIKESWISPSQANFLKNKKYELTSIIVHQGKTVNEGHYVCFCKEEIDNKSRWLYINDKQILNVNFVDVSNHRPYILLYKLVK